MGYIDKHVNDMERLNMIQMMNADGDKHLQARQDYQDLEPLGNGVPSKVCEEIAKLKAEY